MAICQIQEGGRAMAFSAPLFFWHELVSKNAYVSSG